MSHSLIPSFRFLHHHNYLPFNSFPSITAYGVQRITRHPMFAGLGLYGLGRALVTPTPQGTFPLLYMNECTINELTFISLSLSDLFAYEGIVFWLGFPIFYLVGCKLNNSLSFLGSPSYPLLILPYIL